MRFRAQSAKKQSIDKESRHWFLVQVVRLATLVTCLSIAYGPLPNALAQDESETSVPEYVWRDSSGNPLPFQSHEEILEYLQTAKVIRRTVIQRGITRPEKVTLEKNGIRFHAAFRSIDVRQRTQPRKTLPRKATVYRDAAVFERAAYELSELMELGRVPPTVRRRIGSSSGTLQIWMENTLVEVERAQRRLGPPEPVRWVQQKQLQYLFDNLIANYDRNQGNLLIDEHWNLWFIDHTRAFQRTKALSEPENISMCEKNFWKALREVEDSVIRARLDPFLADSEISALLRRRAKLVKHVEGLIAEHGQAAVIYTLRPPASKPVDWTSLGG